MEKKTLYEKISDAVKYIENLDKSTLIPGKHEISEDFFYLYQEYEAKEPADTIFEAHKNYVDIQYIAEGQERIDVSYEKFMEPETPYHPEKDVMFFRNPSESFERILNPGEYIVLLPFELHKPGQKYGCSGTVKKIVGKVRI